jgi:hypothetical protein
VCEMQDFETASAPLEVVMAGCASDFSGGPQEQENLKPKSFARLSGSQCTDAAGSEKCIADAYLLEALTEALQIAFDAAVFSNRFEIDEQEPLSRIEALTERLIEGIETFFSKNYGSQADGKAATISIIDKISKRLRAAISRERM